ncbi:L-lactate permease [Staphylococcus aureus]
MLKLPGDVSVLSVSQSATLTLAIINFIIPFLLIFIIDGFRGVKNITSNFSSFNHIYTYSRIINGISALILVNKSSPSLTMLALAVFSKKFQPKHIYRVNKDEEIELAKAHSAKAVLHAWIHLLY